LVDPLNSALAHLSHHDDYNAIASDLNGMLIRSAECAGMSLEYLTMDPILGIIYESTGWSNPEENWYIYHSDHLGSSSFLTDAFGDPSQHLQYMPFGETFVEQRSVTSYYTPYTFSAKERDPETGYSYFGARYYSSDISVWLSVDPLSDKYPSMSAYMYCAGNPVSYKDPNGKWIEIIVTRYGLDGGVKKWFEIWKRTLHKEVEIIVHNAIVYDGTHSPGNLQDASADIESSILYYWTGRYANKRNSKSVSVSVEFPDGITPIECLFDAHSSGALTTRGNRQSTLFYLADISVIEAISGQIDAGGAAFAFGGNLFLIGTSCTTIGRKPNTIMPENGIESTSAHEFGHGLGLGHSKEGLMHRSCLSNCENNYNTVNKFCRSKVVGRGLRNPWFHYKHINDTQEKFNQ
jgi:RHS repeat-associated protein